MSALASRLEHLREIGRYRQLKQRTGRVDFCSNDYLGLARDPDLLAKVQAAIARCERLGATGSRLLSGQSSEIAECERQLAHFYQGERALLFPSGFQANLALVGTLPQAGDTILFDDRIHASMREAVRLSKATAYPVRHADLIHLEWRLSRATGDVFVCLEALHSMDGDWLDLLAVSQLCERYGAYLLLDEAHSTGIVGGGSGLAVAENLPVPVRTHTFGKALGFQGACLVGDAKWIEALVNLATPFVYTTGVSPLMVAAVQVIHEEVGGMEDRRNALLERIHWYEELTSNGTGSPIQVVRAAGDREVVAAAESLREQGFEVSAIRSPTVRQGEERLRISLHSFNTLEEMQEIASKIETVAYPHVEPPCRRR